MLLMVGKEIRGGLCQAVYKYAKANNNYMKNYNKIVKSSYIEYLDANNLYGWAISQKLPVDSFEQVEENDLSRFNESFKKITMKPVIKDIFLKQMLNIQKIFINYIAAYHFYQKEKNRKNQKACLYCTRKRKLCCPQKSFKTSTKSRIDIKKNMQSNSTQSKSIVETIHRYEY